MNQSQRKKYMKATVLPEMKKLFVGFDKKYKDMTCMTCHGDKAVENKFKMPNDQLPKLPGPTDRTGFMTLQQKKPEAVKFMGTEVKPAMAALLNVDEWSPDEHEGLRLLRLPHAAGRRGSAGSRGRARRARQAGRRRLVGLP